MGKQPEFSWHQLHHKIDTEQIQDTSQPFGQSWERQSAHGQPHPPGERHCSVICISSITISEALCSMKWSLPAATEEILNYKWRSELTQPKKGEVEGGSGRHEPNVVYKDLDSLLSFFFFFALNIFLWPWAACHNPLQKSKYVPYALEGPVLSTREDQLFAHLIFAWHAGDGTTLQGIRSNPGHRQTLLLFVPLHRTRSTPVSQNTLSVLKRSKSSLSEMKLFCTILLILNRRREGTGTTTKT